MFKLTNGFDKRLTVKENQNEHENTIKTQK